MRGRPWGIDDIVRVRGWSFSQLAQLTGVKVQIFERDFIVGKWYCLLPEVKRAVNLADLLDYKWNMSANGKLF
jgi:hypothetical protein